MIEPSDTHDYQPLWTLVGGGAAPLKQSRRAESSVMPKGVHWVKDRAETVDPEAQAVTTAGGQSVGYDYLVVCPGIQLDWGKVPGMADALLTPAVSTNYSYELAPKTWELIKGMRSGTAVFTMPTGPIKCAGAPQKIAYLAADHCAGTKDEITYNLMHVVPPQSAPDWVKRSPLADAANPAGYVEIDKNTMQHTRIGTCSRSATPGAAPTARPAPPSASRRPSSPKASRP